MSEIESEMEYVLRNSCDRAEEKIKELQKRLDYAGYSIIQLNSVGEKYKEKLRHSNYKRCLAMAKWCENAILGWMGHKESYSSHQRHIKVMLFTKWHKRWLELAEKFKEAK